MIYVQSFLFFRELISDHLSRYYVPLGPGKNPLFYATQFHNWQKKEGKKRGETEILLLLQGTKTNN